MNVSCQSSPSAGMSRCTVGLPGAVRVEVRPTTMQGVLPAVRGDCSARAGGCNTMRIVVVRVVELDVAQPVQRGVLAADPVEPVISSPRSSGAPGSAGLVRRPVPGPVLVLLAVEVLLAAGPDGDVLAQLVAGVHPPGGRQRRGQHRPQLERRRAAVLQELVAGCPGCSARSSAACSRPTSPTSSVRYSLSSALVVRQVKYVYDWLKPILPRVCIIAGRVNASARKSTSGWLVVDRRRSATPRTRTGLVCGLSTRKTVTPCVDPQCSTTRRTSA